MIDGVFADERGGRSVATTDARRPQHANVRTQRGCQLIEELIAPREVAGDRLTDAHRDRRRRCLVFLNNVEVVIKGGDFVDLGGSEAHLVGKGREMRGGKMAEAVLKSMQMLDQEITTARLRAQHIHNLLERGWLDVSPLRCRTQRESGESATTILFSSHSAEATSAA